MPGNNEKGQAILLVVVAMGIFLIGALGLAIDGATLYGHREMAQVAADSAAQAAILSIYNGTNNSTNAFASSTSYTHTCTTTDVITPCRYARSNNFGSAAGDTVYIDVPTPASVGVDPAILSGTDPVNLIRVRVTRSVPAGIIRMLGGGPTTDISAVAIAAIIAVETPTPILITHPTMDNALQTNGTTNIIICGGPNKSIQVNSNSPLAYASPKAGGVIDLSHAGPLDTGNCVAGTGADFGTFGGASTNPGSVLLGSAGNYVQPSSVVQDPFLNLLTTPSVPANAPLPVPIPNGTDGCAMAGGCLEYSPGLYAGGLAPNPPSGTGVIFKPGLYYVQGGGFILKNLDGGGGPANNYDSMCVGCTADPDTGTGMVVYDTGPSGDPTNTGGFDVNTGVQATLHGSTITTTNAKGQVVPGPPYYGLLFWEDSNARAHTGSNKPSAGGAHSMGQGNGCFTLIGTIYATNSRATMLADATHYQEVDYNGNPCSSTVQQGYIIAGSLQIVGTTTIRMSITPYGFAIIRRIALVH
jgi:hypothetical protein